MYTRIKRHTTKTATLKAAVKTTWCLIVMIATMSQSVTDGPEKIPRARLADTLAALLSSNNHRLATSARRTSENHSSITDDHVTCFFGAEIVVVSIGFARTYTWKTKDKKNQ